ncbi:MAG TPA: NAD-dependent epimerase/dehydratase family protein [bacterium]|nr:NAD-dependent epimerase/dehydratase family protein [bacterium]
MVAATVHASITLRGTKVLVTGGAGFIGSHTVDALTRAGAEIVVVDNLSTGRRQNLSPSIAFYEVNIADERFGEILRRERPDVIYHFAFYVLVPNSVENPLLDMDAITGSVRLLHEARALGVRKVVFASSGFLYGNTPALPVTEASTVDPVSPYVVAKQTVEGYLRFFHRTYGVPSVVLRYSAVYGPRQVTGAMADYIRKLSAGAQAEMWGDGTKTRDYVYIDDVVNANLLALAIPADHPSPVFNIGTGVETTLNALYQKIADLLGVEARPIYRPDRAGEQMRYCLDWTKARRDLRWEPEYSLDAGLRLTVDAQRGR